MAQLSLIDAGIFKENDLINKVNWEIHGKAIAKELWKRERRGRQERRPRDVADWRLAFAGRTGLEIR